ncbi:hypothetical protein GQ54DRAFT_341970 [Martensiomyces pterosporus]|nr:hypothetical protein GQ54DRAFT_341970 [Martensiomyces pterosporus]
MADRLAIEIIDLDGGSIGSIITQMALEYPRNSRSVRWRIRRGIRSLDEAKTWVRRHGWGALVINEGASQRLDSAMAIDAEYNPYDALTVIQSSGRHPIGEEIFIQPTLSTFAYKASLAYSLRFVRDFVADGNQVPTADDGTPSDNFLKTMAQPVAFRTVDVAPFSIPLASLIYLFNFLVLLLCTIGVLIAWKLTSFRFFLKVKYCQIWVAALGLTTCWCLAFGLYSALAFLAFKGPDYRADHQALPFTFGRFMCIWMTATIVVMAVALWLLSWFLILTPEFVGLASVITVLSNIASQIVPVEQTPRFFRWFYALPFFNGSMLYRYILSGGYPKVGMNLGVILGEIVIMAAVLAAATRFRQFTVINGISDMSGWYRGGMFFHSPIPHYKAPGVEKAPAAAPHKALWLGGPRRPLSIADSVNDYASMKDGNLGV